MSTQYYTTVGLEIHAELKTKSKMWCGCKNGPFTSEPNANICPVCMAHPGTLPVANHEAVRKVVQVGLALGAEIADFTEFDRKNYFYPDIPKGYQISQYKYPIVAKGHLSGVDITRVHLEEDTAKSLHDQGDFTLVDYNRAGVPLMELVTEACIHSSEQAGNFGRELQLILRTLGVSDANMEMGQMRVEVNFSVAPYDDSVYHLNEAGILVDATGSEVKLPMGTKVEVKNLNSFRTVEKAIEYERARHIELIEAGEGSKIVQETRGWDEAKQATFSQRKKENAHDYRYFPDPDLPKMYLHSMFDLEAMRAGLPELPSTRRKRLSSLGIKSDTVDVLVFDIELSHFFDTVTADKHAEFIALAANYATSDLLGILKKESLESIADNFPTTENFVALIEMIQKGKLSSRGAKDVLPLIIKKSEKTVNVIATEMGLIQQNDEGALKKIVEEAVVANPTQWAEYKAGNEKLLMFFVGQAMKTSKGAGNPGVFQKLIKEM